ncbi:hypothetical protein N0V82_001804 [Gnomoniopsis sp. IMI 355080]|nr:hypothetical protein N0V82_001804 [Gnomoniopsis sp. IMI 355080]
MVGQDSILASHDIRINDVYKESDKLKKDAGPEELEPVAFPCHPGLFMGSFIEWEDEESILKGEIRFEPLPTEASLALKMKNTESTLRQGIAFGPIPGVKNMPEPLQIEPEYASAKRGNSFGQGERIRGKVLNGVQVQQKK